MWKFAEVEILSTKQKLIVETQFIEKFEKYSQATKNKVYLLRQLGKSERCLILKTANSMEEINNPRLRSRRPKAHISSLEEKSDDSDDSIDLVMRKRKAKGQNQIQAKNKESQDILTKYEEQRKKDNNLHGEAHERVEEENDGSHEEVDDDDDDDDDVENERENGNRIVDVVIEHAESHNESETNMGTENDRETPDEDLFDTQVSINPINLEGDATDQVQSPRIHNNTKRRNVTDRSNEELRNNELNLRMEQLIEQNRKLNEIIHIMRHEQRSDSRNQCLERERELIELHRRRKLQERAQKQREEVEREQQKQEQQEQQRERERREQEQRDQQQRDREQRERERRERERRERERRERERRERGNQTDDEENDITDQVPIGGQIFISSLAYTEAFREYRPSKFITIMSHAIWGYNNLALRAVKVGKRNAEKLPLTPAKKLVLEKQYKKFLRQRNLSADMETMERNKINTYLGRSITSAIKKNS
ncbi:uncharacterized protein LOC141529521 isoform X2 [Cotesia typhae]